jgi:hypothetical protein
MRKKKLITIALACVIAMTGVPMNASAATMETSKEVSGNQSTQEALEKVILKVKERISIPKECNEFNYDYNNYNYGQEVWSLRWNTSDGIHNVHVKCDSEGNISYYSEYEYEKEMEKSLKLNYLKSELESTALSYLDKIYPSLKGHFQLVSSGYNGTYQNSYYYTYERVENKIAMPDNSVTISISSADKSLKELSSSLIFGVKIPDAQKEISEEKAIALLKDNLQMSLGYYNKVETLKDGSEQIKAYLAYTPNLSYLAVDAKSGKVYTTRSEWNYYGSKEDSSSARDTAKGSSENGLTQEEISKIEEMSDLLSKEEAIAVITGNKYLLLDNSAKAITATLTQQNTYLSLKEGSKTDYYWNISFIDPREPDYKANDYYRAYSNAKVDAKTGELLSYNASTKSADYENAFEVSKNKILYNDEKCQKIFETFVSSVNKDRYLQTKLVSAYDSYILAYSDTAKIVGGLGYCYNRFNDDVEYSYNNIYGDVDKVTGKVYSYGYRWDENVIFESKKGAISAKEACDAFMKLDGFDLVYEYNTINTYNTDYLKSEDYYYNNDAYSVDFEVRLVYSIEGINPKIISPFTKKQLDWNGEEVNLEKANITKYVDIYDSPYQRSIELLSDMGLEYSSSLFNPNKKISMDELVMFTRAAGLSFDESLREGVFTTYYVSRQSLAKYICYIMGVEEVGSLSGIFTTGYTDEASIDKDYVGFVAIAKGFSLLKADEEGNFNPKTQITRGEVADILINLIQK